MHMEILNKYHNDLGKKETYTDDLPSRTVPDQSLTVKELLERFTSGIITPQSVWHEDIGDDFSDFDNPNPADSPDFDLTDREAIRERARMAQDEAAEIVKRRQRRTKKEATNEKEPATPKEELMDE